MHIHECCIEIKGRNLFWEGGGEWIFHLDLLKLQRPEQGNEFWELYDIIIIIIQRGKEEVGNSDVGGQSEGHKFFPPNRNRRGHRRRRRPTPNFEWKPWFVTPSITPPRPPWHWHTVEYSVHSRHDFVDACGHLICWWIVLLETYLIFKWLQSAVEIQLSYCLVPCLHWPKVFVIYDFPSSSS